MSGESAARVGDLHSCKLSDGPKPHVGGLVLPPGEKTVLIGGFPAARMGDKVQCVSPAVNTIVKGAFPVPIGKKPAARVTDLTAHGGKIELGCNTVKIGLSGTTGNRHAGNAACEAAKKDRNGGAGGNGQSYNNCGIESSRQVINQATPANLTEDGLLSWAKNNPTLNNAANGFPIGPPGTPNAFAHGGTFPSTQAAILGQNGVPAAVQSAANPANLQNAMMQGQGVIANVDAGALWPTTTAGWPTPANPGPGAWHAVTVTGVEYDDAGKITNYYINDTGTGQCDVQVPAATFDNALGQYHTPGNGLVVTNNPIW